MHATKEKSEVTKKFEAGILNQGVDEIGKPSATSKVTDSGAQNPVTGAGLQSAASEGARSSRQNSTEPVASAATKSTPVDYTSTIAEINRQKAE